MVVSSHTLSKGGAAHTSTQYPSLSLVVVFLLLDSFNTKSLQKKITNAIVAALKSKLYSREHSALQYILEEESFEVVKSSYIFVMCQEG